MKNEQLSMNKERGAIFFYLLPVICYLLFGCANPFELTKAQQQAEKGYFSLGVNGVQTGRTIMPQVAQSDFAKYTLEFFAEGTSSNPVTSVTRTNTDLTGPVILNAGTWDLQVTAYFDAAMEERAAQGSLAGIAIGPGATVQKNVTLTAVIEEGEGTLSWNIAYPGDVDRADMTITPLDDQTGTAEQTVSLLDSDPNYGKESSVTLNTGYYRVVINLRNSAGQNAMHREILHIYKNKDSIFLHTFTESNFAGTIIVTNGDDSGAGSLRQAISDAQDGGMIIIDRNVATIALAASLSINKSLIIEGNSATITRNASWITEDTTSQLLRFTTSVTVSISRVHFKDGKATSNGAAIFNNGGTVTLESCIFSGNQTSGGSSNGGAINSINSSSMGIKGCTFFGNTTGQYGGAIYINGNSSTLTLVGNLFYGNTARLSYSAVYNNNGTVTSNGYNVVNVALGTGSTQSGFTAADNETDTGSINILPVSPVSFRLLSDSPAAEVITSLPADYPAFDFYGNNISASAAAGAVQSVAGTGYYLELSVNNSDRGSINVDPQPDVDGLVSDTVTITATPAGVYSFAYWLVDGVKNNSPNPLSLDITAHTTVQAVFVRVIAVTLLTDNISGNGTEGDLRYAVNNAESGDIIRFTEVTAGTSVVKLVRALPGITKDISIEGNGVIITREASWTPAAGTQLLLVDTGATVNVSRVHFKDGRATSYAGAIRNAGGNLTLESCIFSGNQTTVSSANGGAVYNSNAGTMSVKGCTFYRNSTASEGGAIYNSGTMTIEGNLFYGNTAPTYPVIRRIGGSLTSNGYNVVDAVLGTGTVQSGFTSSTVVPNSDKGNINVLPISPVNFKLLSGSDAAGVITTSLPVDYPAFDFYGNSITVPAAAGAVQAAASGTGYILDVSFDNSAVDNISIDPQPDAEGFVPAGTVTITVTPVSGYSFLYWLVNGDKDDSSSTLNFSITTHTTVQVVFEKVITVTLFSDNPSGDGTEGDLRYALNNAVSGDTIRFIGVTAGDSVALARALPTITGKTITIEGNGVTITRSDPSSSSYIRLLSIGSGATVNISRVHFKDGRFTTAGAGINNTSGNVSLESCIFSGNESTSSSSTESGGAIFNNGTMSIKGCTFYGNKAFRGGAIQNESSRTLTLVGNLFFGNTVTGSYQVVYNNSGTVSSQGYNVVDVTLGTSTSGFNAASNDIDKTLAQLLGSNATSPFEDAASGNFAPVSGVQSVIPAAIDGFPATDFFGITRTWPGAPGAVK